jgi:hypothetical protein
VKLSREEEADRSKGGFNSLRKALHADKQWREVKEINEMGGETLWLRDLCKVETWKDKGRRNGKF